MQNPVSSLWSLIDFLSASFCPILMHFFPSLPEKLILWKLENILKVWHILHLETLPQDL